MDEDQWFRHPEMQARIAEAEADFREGRFVETTTPEEAQAYLDSLKRPEDRPSDSTRGQV